MIGRKYMSVYKIMAATVLLLCSATVINAQETSENQPTVVSQLFEYPVAPENLSTLAEKSDWLMLNFWNNMNLASKTTVDQSALNHAFQVYCVPMQWASKDAVMQGNRNLLKKIEKNPPLLLQFTKAAEETLYGPRSNMWIDEVYVLYLEELCKSKKIDKLRKLRYQDQLNQLTKSAVGKYAPPFDYENIAGDNMKYYPMATFTILEFGDPDCDDCRRGALSMESNIAFSKLIDSGKVNVVFMIPDAEDDWNDKVIGFSKKWIIGATENAGDVYDLRQTPSIYVIDGNGKIIAKHITVREAMEIAINELSNK